MTNGDRIRQMSNEELVRIFRKNDKCYFCLYEYNGLSVRGLCDCRCEEGIKAYLESECE